MTQTIQILKIDPKTPKIIAKRVNQLQKKFKYLRKNVTVSTIPVPQFIEVIAYEYLIKYLKKGKELEHKAKGCYLNYIPFKKSRFTNNFKENHSILLPGTSYRAEFASEEFYEIELKRILNSQKYMNDMLINNFTTYDTFQPSDVIKITDQHLSAERLLITFFEDFNDLHNNRNFIKESQNMWNSIDETAISLYEKMVEKYYDFDLIMGIPSKILKKVPTDPEDDNKILRRKIERTLTQLSTFYVPFYFILMEHKTKEEQTYNIEVYDHNGRKVTNSWIFLENQNYFIRLIQRKANYIQILKKEDKNFSQLTSRWLELMSVQISEEKLQKMKELMFDLNAFEVIIKKDHYRKIFDQWKRSTQLEKEKWGNIAIEQKRNEIEEKLRRISLSDQYIFIQNQIRNLKDMKRNSFYHFALNMVEFEKELKKKSEFIQEKVIKTTTLEMSTKFDRIQIQEIGEKCGVPDDILIISIIKKMIQTKQLMGEFFTSTNSILFDKQSNITQMNSFLENLEKEFQEWDSYEQNGTGKEI